MSKPNSRRANNCVIGSMMHVNVQGTSGSSKRGFSTKAMASQLCRSFRGYGMDIYTGLVLSKSKSLRSSGEPFDSASGITVELQIDFLVAVATAAIGKPANGKLRNVEK